MKQKILLLSIAFHFFNLTCGDNKKSKQYQKSTIKYIVQIKPSSKIHIIDKNCFDPSPSNKKKLEKQKSRQQLYDDKKTKYRQSII